MSLFSPLAKPNQCALLFTAGLPLCLIFVDTQQQLPKPLIIKSTAAK